MMEFDEIVVKESPGLCRCCLSEGCYKDLGTEYNWMNETEVYADMLLECFDISITQHNEGPNGPNRLICEVCITRLRDACNFKKQVMDSEKKFIDMMGRGEFRPKMLIYQAQMKCEDPPTTEVPVEDAADIEYLEDDIDFGDDDLKDDLAQPSVSEVSVALPAKGKRGRPRKNTPVKPEKRAKVPKLDDKARASKAVAKEIARPQETQVKTEINKEDITKTKESQNATPEVKTVKTYGVLETQKILRENVTQVLERSTLMPFRWLKNAYRCFYCYEIFQQPKDLKDHQEVHVTEDISKKMKSFLDPAVNVDVSNISCKLCPEKIDDVHSLVDHLIAKHGIKFNKDIGIGMNPFILNTLNVSCAICKGIYQTFGRLLSHTNKYHKGPTNILCELCGDHFSTTQRMKEHVSNKHYFKTIKCKLCDDRMAPTKIRTHMQRIHGKTYKCMNCNEIFDTHYKRRLHMMDVHKNNEKIKCPKCPLDFVYHSFMMKHFRESHLHEKNAMCGVCGWQGFELSRLQMHMQRHTNERNFTCDNCSKAFKTKKGLTGHLKTVHKMKGKPKIPRRIVPKTDTTKLPKLEENV
ncbi:hypothetical protein PYW08_012709 [Mythimna loreyi]|uniref:Uncharacterized protein n=1 Tax=Mythimna loreyi TaxID=667449 RepID=A0ACC2Q0V6_9NEOP|nr:hypothetical protein PYW08_012709 [Mythimna loreyi]